MQLISEINGQAVCEKVLATDSRIMYSGYITSDGSRVGEAMTKRIVDYEKLTVIVLPLHPPCSNFMVLAATPSSDLKEIIQKAKQAINARTEHITTAPNGIVGTDEDNVSLGRLLACTSETIKY